MRSTLGKPLQFPTRANRRRLWRTRRTTDRSERGPAAQRRSFLELPRDGEESGSRGFEDKDKGRAYDCYGAEEELEYV